MITAISYYCHSDDNILEITKYYNYKRNTCDEQVGSSHQVPCHFARRGRSLRVEFNLTWEQCHLGLHPKQHFCNQETAGDVHRAVWQKRQANMKAP